MELWIRSQDKERLIKPLDFYIEETLDYENEKSEFDIYALNLVNADIRIGTYNTKERALEVLDKIQGKITQNECIKTMLPMANDIKGYEEKFGALFKEMIYEMPKE